jgi:hypothetical protein
MCVSSEENGIRPCCIDNADNALIFCTYRNVTVHVMDASTADVT